LWTSPRRRESILFPLGVGLPELLSRRLVSDPSAAALTVIFIYVSAAIRNRNASWRRDEVARERSAATLADRT